MVFAFRCCYYYHSPRWFRGSYFNIWDGIPRKALYHHTGGSGVVLLVYDTFTLPTSPTSIFNLLT
jgi:hypothetical protein